MRSMVEGERALLKDISPKPTTDAVRRARKLRRKMTLPKVLLWQQLRERPHGIKFRRQHETGIYVLDFYCSDARLAIEVDGSAHNGAERADRDHARDAWLARHEIDTLRVMASDVLADYVQAAQAIADFARARLPLHHPAAQGGAPPRDKLGEDLIKRPDSPRSARSAG